MAKMFYDQDADLSLLEGKTIGIIGYGSQGHAQALNLRDSGCKVLVADAPGSDAWKAAEKAGFDVSETADVSKKADIIVFLAPDDLQPQIYRQAIEPQLVAGKTLQFAHGFNIYYHQIVPPPSIDVTMVAPKIHGVLLRKLFTENQGPPGSVAVHQDSSGKAMSVALAYSKAIGCTRGGGVETTFKEETVTTLPKAKETARLAEKLISLAKDSSVHHRRLAVSFINDKETVSKLFSVIAPRYESQKGGYTKIIKLGYRRGDSALICKVKLA